MYYLLKDGEIQESLKEPLGATHASEDFGALECIKVKIFGGDIVNNEVSNVNINADQTMYIGSLDQDFTVKNSRDGVSSMIFHLKFDNEMFDPLDQFSDGYFTPKEDGMYSVAMDAELYFGTANELNVLIGLYSEKDKSYKGRRYYQTQEVPTFKPPYRKRTSIGRPVFVNFYEELKAGQKYFIQGGVIFPDESKKGDEFSIRATNKGSSGGGTSSSIKITKLF